MTLQATRDKLDRLRRRPTTNAASTYPIGDANLSIISCPTCARPLGTGARRCTGCGTRLVAGVQLGRAMGFVAVGITVGALVGATSMGLVVAGRPGADPVVNPPVAVASGDPVPSPSAVSVGPVAPSAALSALRQSATLNQRILADADRLKAVMALPSASGKEIAPILRNLATTASYGGVIATDVKSWEAGRVVGASLSSFYGKIGKYARQGLSASVSNGPAYVSAASYVLRVVARLRTLDSESRTLAADAGIDLPPVLPEVKAP